MNLFIVLLFSHIIGDFFLQNDWMALNKKKHWLPCLIHCHIYTMVVYAFVGLLLPNELLPNLIAILTIFFSHLAIDKTSIIEKWFKLIKGRSWTRMTGLYPNRDPKIQDTARIVYTAIVQTVADQTLHLMIMYFVLYFLV